MVIAYSRVSSNEQDIEKYKSFFKRYQESMGVTFDDIILEKISASKTKIEGRHLWNYIKDPKVKKIVVTEISRIGRNTNDGVKLLKYISEQREDLEIYVVMSNLTIKRNMTAEEEFLFDLQLSLAKREVKLLSERTKIGIEKARESGKHIGRPFGSTKITKEKELQIEALLSLGKSKTYIAKNLIISRTTLYKYVNNIALHKKN